jgi:hypothetical protein
MNFKDLQFSIGKLTTDIRSQMARRNPLQSHDTKALNLWVFEERNDVASLKTCNYHHKETDKAFLSWITEEVARNPQENEDIEVFYIYIYKRGAGTENSSFYRILERHYLCF